MERVKFSLRSLADLDYGKIDIAFRGMLKRVLDDLVDRPEEKKERVVELKVIISPAEVERGALETVNVQFKLGSKVPGLQSRGYNMSASSEDLIFNNESPDDAKQTTFGYDNKTKEPEKEDQE